MVPTSFLIEMYTFLDRDYLIALFSGEKKVLLRCVRGHGHAQTIFVSISLHKCCILMIARRNKKIFRIKGSLQFILITICWLPKTKRMVIFCIILVYRI